MCHGAPLLRIPGQDYVARLTQQAPSPAGPKCEGFGYLDLNIACLPVSLSLCRHPPPHPRVCVHACARVYEFLWYWGFNSWSGAC